MPCPPPPPHQTPPEGSACRYQAVCGHGKDGLVEEGSSQESDDCSRLLKEEWDSSGRRCKEDGVLGQAGMRGEANVKCVQWEVPAMARPRDCRGTQWGVGCRHKRPSNALQSATLSSVGKGGVLYVTGVGTDII